MKYLAHFSVACLLVLFSLSPAAHAEAWPDGPYPNKSAYWANKDVSSFVVQDAWKTADIIGFDDLQNEVTSLRSENSRLQNKLSNLESRLQLLEDSRPSQSSVVNTTVVQEADMSRVAALEKEMKIQGMVISMMEVNIGSLYARMDQLLAPILKKLGL